MHNSLAEAAIVDLATEEGGGVEIALGAVHGRASTTVLDNGGYAGAMAVPAVVTTAEGAPCTRNVKNQSVSTEASNRFTDPSEAATGEETAGSDEHENTVKKGAGAQPIPLDRPVTLYENVADTVGKVRTLRQCLDHIRSHKKLAKLMPKLRSLYQQAKASGTDKDKAAYDCAKKKLPAFTMSGTFTKRGILGLEKYSRVIQVDLDHLTDKNMDIGQLRQRLAADPQVFFCYTSPSGDGLKCGSLVSSGAEDHTAAFLALQRYFEATYGLRPDDATKDVSRLCFLSYDPEIYVNEAPLPFDWPAWAGSAPAAPVEQEADEEDTAVPLPLDAFPTIMRELAIECAAVYRVDPALPAVSACTIMAAALGKSVACEGAVNGRSTPANTMTVIGAPPSYGKGVGAKMAAPLISASMELGEHFEKIIRPRLLADIAFAEERKKEILKEQKDDSLTDEGRTKLKDEFARIEGEIERWRFEAEQAPSYFTGSATGAALGMALKRNGEQMFSLAMEAGDAIRVAAGRYTADQKGDYDLFLSGYTGEPFAEDRAKRKLRLAAPCLNVQWFVQPSLLRELFGTPEAQDRGLLARLNVCQCQHDSVPYDDGVFREVRPELEQRWDRLVRAALKLRQGDRGRTFRAELEAAEVFRLFHNETVDTRNGEGRELEAKLLRGRENAIRIALVFAATEWLEAGVEGAAPVLTAEHAARGVALAQYFLAETLNLTRSAAMDKRQARLAEVLAIVAQAGGQITLRRLRDHHCVGEMELRQIVERNFDQLKIETPAPGAKGGRPSPRLVTVQKK